MKALLDALNENTALSLPYLMKFIIYASTLKNDIILAYPSTFQGWQDAPPFLPPSMVEFLAAACTITQADVERCWALVKGVVWALDPSTFNDTSLLAAFKISGSRHGYPSPRTLWPPTSYCMNRQCPRSDMARKIQVAEQRQAILYTVAHGPIPAWSVHLECTDCRTTYYVDYWERGNIRTYYDTCSGVVQVSGHKYVEVPLIQSWKNGVNTAWVSFSNCASMYVNQYPSADEDLPPQWKFKASTLDGEEVYDGFLVISLLEDCRRRNTVLSVPHGGLQSQRFVKAIQARNLRMRLYGLPHIDHACTKCVRIIKGDGNEVDREVSAVVMDGITLGRPTCGVALCKLPLASVKDRFCPSHQEQNSVCCIVGCTRTVRPTFRTCDINDHKRIEDVHLQRSSAAFQYKQRLERARVAHPKNSDPVDTAIRSLLDEEDALEETYEVVGDQVLPSNTDQLTQAKAARQSIQPEVNQPPTPVSEDDNSQPKKLRAIFGRKRTHNEQILVAPCGVIIARETFFNAEAIPSVVEMIKNTYTNRHKPNHIIFDNNCSVAKHIKNDEFFRHIGLAVDVFHFKCKHSQTDTFCQENCNPHSFPELRGENGQGWYFNTSIAEQTNVWLGGFHSICREMTADRFDFFLDEMVIMRNRTTLARLRKKQVLVVQ
ncbi:hypothetical protein H1R20_g702, partial [Candolleomyces eurysporus]